MIETPKTTKKITKYWNVKEAAKFMGIGLNSMYNAIYAQDVIPDKILWPKTWSGKKPEVKQYLFTRDTLLMWKKEREKYVPTSKATAYVNLSQRQIRLRVYDGRLIPDKVKMITKGSRGSYYHFFFLKRTLCDFVRNSNLDTGKA